MCMGTSNWRAMAYSRSISPTFSGVTLPFSFTSTPPRPQKAHRSKGFFKPARAAAQGFVGGVIGPVEGDVHPPGLVAGKKVGPLFIQQGAVGVQGKHHALGLQGQIQLLKSGHQQRPAAGRGPQSPPNSSFSAAV